MKSILVVSGAFYYSEEYKAVIKCCRTGEFWMVDCIRYIQKRRYIENFGKQSFKDNEDNFVLYEGEKYFSEDGSIPLQTIDFDLLSDLSDLKHEQESYNF